MGIFKRKSRKDKRGIKPASPPSVIYVETYDLTGDEPVQMSNETVYVAPEPSYDRSPTTYDSPPASTGGGDW